ncbi:hypothetical protein Plhal304r1_c046g0128151 [Plasmopara halstedii]
MRGSRFGHLVKLFPVCTENWLHLVKLVISMTNSVPDFFWVRTKYFFCLLDKKICLAGLCRQLVLTGLPMSGARVEGWNHSRRAIHQIRERSSHKFRGTP